MSLKPPCADGKIPAKFAAQNLCYFKAKFHNRRTSVIHLMLKDARFIIIYKYEIYKKRNICGGSCLVRSVLFEPAKGYFRYRHGQRC